MKFEFDGDEFRGISTYTLLYEYLQTRKVGDESVFNDNAFLIQKVCRGFRKNVYTKSAMDNIEAWLAPLLILPGVGMLIMSTSTRNNFLHQEIHHLVHDGDVKPDRMSSLYRRSKFFRNALVSLYVAVGIFVLSGLLGGIWQLVEIDGYWVNAVLSFVGIISMQYAACELIRESLLSMEVIEEHFGPHMDSKK